MEKQEYDAHIWITKGLFFLKNILTELSKYINPIIFIILEYVLLKS